MTSKRILTIFGATGNQGGSIIDLVLARPSLSAKYALRAVTRDPSSTKSQALSSKGVEVVKADLEDFESLKSAVKNSYGVFGVTDFWTIPVEPSGPSAKQRETEQGKNIFLAAQTASVKHFVFSSLPKVAQLSKGRYTGVEHFDGKAEVQEYVEANKGEMIASYFMPAMFISFVKQLIASYDGVPTLSLPFPEETRPWPLLAPRRDGGKYVMGLFEAQEKANGVAVQGVSTWTTPRELVNQSSKLLGKEVKWNSISGETFGSFLPEAIRDDLVQMMLWIGEESYYGLGTEKKQSSSNEFLIEGADLVDWPGYIAEDGEWAL